jgi:hypothetical protein
MSNENKRSKRIKEIAKEIEQLSEELNALLLVEDNTKTRSQQQIHTADDIVLGNVVEVTNTYKNLQGSRGTVIKVTKHQVTIRLENNVDVIKRKKSNVRKVL